VTALDRGAIDRAGLESAPSVWWYTLRAWEGPITRFGVEIIAHAQKCSSCGEALYDYEEERGRSASSTPMRSATAG
jgi:hypothetical protein